MTNIDANGVTLHVRDSGGDGVPVLHGWPDTGDVWRHQGAALSAAGYRVRRAGVAQKEKSWYILLFQFAGIAEE